jgi:hypothetical protein
MMCLSSLEIQASQMKVAVEAVARCGGSDRRILDSKHPLPDVNAGFKPGRLLNPAACSFVNNF